MIPLYDLYDFGDYLVQIYALDSATLVMLDYNYRQKTLRQRLVKVFEYYEQPKIFMASKKKKRE